MINYLISFRIYIQIYKQIIRKYQYLFIGIYAALHFIFASFPTLAIQPCNEIFPDNDDVSASWRDRFPFDLVYPVGSQFNNPNVCPKIDFWGKQREVCSVGTITKIVKNAVLFKIAIQGLFTL